jgi:AraC-like DNA-binding protein
MSLSTLKRHFTSEYNEAPENGCKISAFKSKELLQDGELKASDIYLDIGYNNLSNFSIAKISLELVRQMFRFEIIIITDLMSFNDLVMFFLYRNNTLNFFISFEPYQ